MFRNIMPKFDVEDDYSGGNGGAPETPDKTFTQAELDRIIEERLSRERKKYSDFDEYKGVIDELTEYGYTGTPKEIREAVKQQREAYQQQEELNKLQEQAEEEGITPSLAKKIKDLEKAVEDSKKIVSDIIGEREAKAKEAELKRQQDEDWSKQVKDFESEFSDVDLEELAKNQKFVKFVKGKKLPLVELYRDFTELIGEAEAETIAKVKSKDERSTSSGKGASSDGGSYGLTDRQKALAKSSGMAFKEYAEYLKHIQ